MAGKLSVAGLIDISNVTSELLTLYPNIDYYYGPYASLAIAFDTLKNAGRNVLGATVGIIQNGIIKEYWLKSGTTQASDFVIKSEGLTDAERQEIENLKDTAGGEYIPVNTPSYSTLIGNFKKGDGSVVPVNVPAVGFTTNVKAEEIAAGLYSPIGKLVVGDQETTVYTRNPLTTSISYQSSSAYTDAETYGTLVVGLNTYYIKGPDIKYTKTYNGAGEVLGTLTLNNVQYQIVSPKTDVQFTSAYDTNNGYKVATLTINNTAYSIFVPKGTGNPTSDQILDLEQQKHQDELNATFIQDSQRLDSVEQDISEITSTIQGINSDIEILQTDLNELNTPLGDITSRLSSVETLTQNLIDDTSEILSDVDDLKLAVASNTLFLEENYNSISKIDTRLDVNEQKVDENQASISQLNRDLENASVEMDTLLRSVGQDVSELQSSVQDFLQSVNQQLQGFVDNGLFALNSDQVSIQDNITNTENATNGENITKFVPSVLAVYNALGGLKFAALTQALYNELLESQSADSSTIYFVVEDDEIIYTINVTPSYIYLPLEGKSRTTSITTSYSESINGEEQNTAFYHSLVLKDFNGNYTYSAGVNIENLNDDVKQAGFDNQSVTVTDNTSEINIFIWDTLDNINYNNSVAKKVIPVIDFNTSENRTLYPDILEEAQKEFEAYYGSLYTFTD